MQKKKYNMSTSDILFFAFLLLLLIVEGWGLPQGRTLGLHMIIFAPFVLFLVDYVSGHKTKIPKQLGMIMASIGITLSLSTWNSVDIQTAFEHHLLYIAIFLLAIYVYDHKSEIKAVFPGFIIIATIATILYALFILIFEPAYLHLYVPAQSYQFVFTAGEGHNLIGSLLLIPVVISYFLGRSSGTYKIVFACLFVLMILTYLRASYIAFAVVVLIDISVSYYRSKKLNTKLVALFLLILLAGIILTYFGTQLYSESSIKQSIISAMNNGSNTLQQKSSISDRIEFVEQGLKSIQGNWTTGIGSFNFSYTSARYADNYTLITGSSHNMFIDILVENGVLAGSLFIVMFVIVYARNLHYVKSSSLLNKSLVFVSIALILLVSMSHYHKQYFMLVLLFVVNFLLYSEKKSFVDKRYLVLLSGVIFLVNIYIVNAKFLYAFNMTEKALTFYPIYSHAHISTINEVHLNNDTDIVEKLNRYHHWYPNNEFALQAIALAYQWEYDHEQSLLFYKKALEQSPKDIDYILNIYNLTNTIYGKKVAAEFVSDHTSRHNIVTGNEQLEDALIFQQWCLRNDIECY